MTLASTIGFALAMVILAATPGPAFFAVTTRSMTNGIMAGLGVVVGVTIGDIVFLALALLGMTAVSQAMGSLFFVFKIAGGAYLIWLGIKMWRQKPVNAQSGSAKETRGFLKNVLEGLAVNLTNPKAIIFFAALLPTFVELSRVTLQDAFVLVGIIILVGAIVDGTYVLLASRVSTMMQSEKAQTRLNRISGATLASVGVAVATR